MTELIDRGKPKRGWTRAVVAFIVGVTLGLLVSHFDWGLLTPSYTLTTYLSNSSGLRVRSQVRVAGVPVGEIRSIRVSASGPMPVQVSMRIAKKYQSTIRADSQVRIATDGLFGDEYLEISRGAPSQPVLAAGGTLRAEPTPGFFDPAACEQLVKTLSRLAGVVRTMVNE